MLVRYKLILNFKEFYLWQYHVTALPMQEKIRADRIMQKNLRICKYALIAQTHVFPIEFAHIADSMMDAL